MSLQKTTMKSLEKWMMELNGEIKQLRADYGKGQKDLFNEIRELKEELTTQKKESQCFRRVC